MKALTDKIIVTLYDEHDKHLSDRDDYLAGLNFAADTIIKLEKEADFEEIARVMMKHLGSRTDLYHPHHTVIVTSTTAELVEGQKTVGQIMEIMEYIPD